jgi:aryl-alcohol dehydrogenase-like predicted oxidoreductase
MRYRLLGHTGLRVSELFLGAQAFRPPASGPGETSPRRLVDVYAEAGGNVVDTSCSYGEGASETVVGELLEGRRDRFVVATKYGWTRDGGDPNAGGIHRKNLTRSLEASLRRLRTDHVDLLWAQMWDGRTPIEETMRALDDVVRAGKVLYVGFCTSPAWVVARANALAEWHGWAPFAAVRVPYDLLNRDAERELVPMAEALGLTVATWGPASREVLSGRSGRAGSERGAPAEPAPGDTLEALREVAEAVGATPAQIALAWTRARSRTIHPIVIAPTVGQLEDDLRAVDIDLPDEAFARLDAATGFTPGYPLDFIAEAAPWVLGQVDELVDRR